MPRPTPSSAPKAVLPPASVFGVRLRQARERMGISQEALATSAGIDEFSASARISQYETGKHAPRYEIACKLAEVLSVSVAFFYADDNATAELLLVWKAAPAAAKQRAIACLEG
ncbi:helix-turn-helix domain-containing protein [Roseateles sp. NT4]|uniref:helix-turn-helix domain-containing protein n=1 Tax=Roseateles sp. NT4 TaxID=3453715 RepID=UPI003EED2620